MKIINQALPTEDFQKKGLTVAKPDCEQPSCFGAFLGNV